MHLATLFPTPGGILRVPIPPPSTDRNRLPGDHAACQKCQVDSDCLLIYEPGDTTILMRTGTNSDVL